MRLGVHTFGLMTAVLLCASGWADDVPPSLPAVAAALGAGHAQDAEALATRLLSNDSLRPIDKAYALLDRALAREQLGRRADAISDFAMAINSKSLPQAELARALFDRGVVQDELGRTAEAIADYSGAIALAPRYAPALNNRANAYRRMKQYGFARTDYEAALAAGDDEPEYPFYGLGRVAEALGDPVAAKNYYTKALAANALFAPATERVAALGDGHCTKLRFASAVGGSI